MDIKSHLLEVTNELKLIDTHEHMERTPDEKYPGGDLFDIIKNTFYLWADLVSSGMPTAIWDGLDEDDDTKWNRIRTHLPRVINTGYYLGIIKGLRCLHNFEGMTIDDSNWKSLNDNIRSTYKDALWPEKILREKTHIERAINDVDGFNMNRSLFLPAIKFDYLLRGGTEEGRNQIYKMDGEHIETFDEYTAFLDRKINEFKAKGAVTLKTVTPYYRGMDYIDVPENEARRAYDTRRKSTPQQQKLTEDFAFHFIIRKAVELALPVQIHTGILAWNHVILEHCNPARLNPLFLKYPGCRFILFHGGFPFTDETGALVKAFPNVFLDFCWLPWISKSITKSCLHDWLDLVPYSKLMWGGDANRAECVHGHWLIAQQMVTEVLNEKVLDQCFSAESAAQIAKGIFRNNAIDILQLDLPKE